MKKQVLSIDQCKELLALGLDMSDASCAWCPTYKSNGCLVDYDTIEEYNVSFRNNTTPIEVLREKFPMTFKDGNVYYTYTLQDIIDKLPNEIEIIYPLKTQVYSGKYNVMNFGYWRGERAGWYVFCQDMQSTLDSAYELLKWCIENKHINI